MVQRLLMAFVIAMSIGCLWVVPAGAASIVATPNTVTIGGTLTLSGDVLVNGTLAGCPPPDTVILISGAFPGNDYGPGQGAVRIPVDSTGHFTGTVVVNPSAGPGTYTIGGRCGGGNIGVDARVTVTGLPRTGGSFGPLSDGQAVVVGSGLVLAGVAALAFARRHQGSKGTRTHA